MAGKVSFLTGLRRMVYLVTPNETSFDHVSEVPKYVDEAVPFFILFVAVEMVVNLLRGDGKMRINDGITSMSAGLFSRSPRYFVRSFELVSYIWLYENVCVRELPWDSASTWWLAFLGVDMGYYWFHRFAHEMNFMWAAHQVHHSSEDYNFTTALRQSMFQRYTSWVFYLPMALFIPPSIFVVHQQFNLLYQFWIHTEYVRKLGPLEYILNTPSHHRVHHGRNPYCIDKNYAGTLIIWDRIFGTFQAEDEEVVFGLTHPINTFEPVTVQLCHLKYMWGRLKEEQGLTNKLSVIFKGPGWSPGKPRLGDLEDIPKVKAPIEKYNSGVPLWCGVYVVIHFFIVLLVSQNLVASIDELSPLVFFLGDLFVLLSLTSFGCLFDNRYYSPFLELFRCVLFIVCVLAWGILGQHDVWKPSLSLHLAQFWFIFSAVLWLVNCWRVMSAKDEASKEKDK